MKVFLFVALCIAVTSAISSVVQEWSSFKTKHGKVYKSAVEEQFRFGVYMSNKQMIQQHNQKYKAGLVSFEMKLNQFADKLQDEVMAEVNGFNKSGQVYKRKSGLMFVLSDADVPSSIDWRQQGAVTPVKNQGSCGSCWAFSSTGSLEGQIFRKTGKLVSLSEQNLVDCANEQYGNQGCSGGLMNQAFDYIRENEGIDSEESYPYEAIQAATCRFRKSNVAGSVSSYVDIPAQDEETLKRAVATIGPISVAINAGLHSFTFYNQGIYNDEFCDPATLNHGVLLVGYGTEGNQDYWLVKNSWSSRWGEGGYIKIARNQGNVCGIASMASYPLV